MWHQGAPVWHPWHPQGASVWHQVALVPPGGPSTSGPLTCQGTQCFLYHVDMCNLLNLAVGPGLVVVVVTV